MKETERDVGEWEDSFGSRKGVGVCVQAGKSKESLHHLAFHLTALLRRRLLLLSTSGGARRFPQLRILFSFRCRDDESRRDVRGREVSSLESTNVDSA